MTTSPIKPTIGRRVWFRPCDQFLERNPTMTQLDAGQPMDAGIVYVHHDHMVNLAVCDHVGRTHMVPSVPLLAGQWDPSDIDWTVCEWMPYQKGQAAKAEGAPGAVESKTYPDGTVATGPGPLPDASPAGAVPPHQQRVLAEKMDRDQEITRLDTFIRENPVFQTLPAAEQARLRRQLDVMHELSAVLGERIANF